MLMTRACEICQNPTSNRLHSAREMMFGTRERFNYLECRQCGCLQLVDVPADLGKYYPPGYYSFGDQGPVKAWIQSRWAAYTMGHFSLVGWAVDRFLWRYGGLTAIRRAGIGRAASILDVGCGSGMLIRDLHRLGFTNVTGLDPYIPKDTSPAPGVLVHKKQLGEMNGQFDLIMLHHSFEHMSNPLEVMRQLTRLVVPKGLIMIRIPVADSYAWRHYGTDWMHMDPPRHLFLHTRKSIEQLAREAGLRVAEVIQEGNETAFLGSEQYRADIPLHDPRSFASSSSNLIRNWFKVRKYMKQAEELNHKGEGDWACFHLRLAGHN